MKKFGTPSGAAPGSANENVGFAVVGTPGPVGPVVFGLNGLDFDLAFDLDLWVLLLALEVTVWVVFVVLVMSLPLVLPGFLNPDEPPLC